MISFQSPHAEYVTPLSLLLNGDRSPFDTVRDWKGLFDAADYHGVALLIFHLWRGKEISRRAVPPAVFDLFEQRYFEAAAREILYLRELQRLSRELANEAVRFAFIKGVATAYTVYPLPFLRSRVDVDLICESASRAGLGRALFTLGYREIQTANSSLLFGQNGYALIDPCGIEHCLDVHWEISARKVVAKRLSIGEILEASASLPSVSPFARRPNERQTLLIACTHAVAHHANDLRLIWLYESALLARRLNHTAWNEFIRETSERQLGSPVAEILESCEARFPRSIPLWVLRRLVRGIGSTESRERWHSRKRGRWPDLIWDLSHLNAMRKLLLLKETVFPRRDYMIARWGVGKGILTAFWLPYLYIRRVALAGMRAVFMPRR